jgi:hypothetical protein
MYLAPELAIELHDNASNTVQIAIDEYNLVAPYWFVSKFNTSYEESANATLYDYHAMFQAKAMILQESWEDLAKYLDVPAVEIGDLFYIDNLCAILEAY